MAESNEKKVLIDVEIKAKDALEAYAKLKIAVDELKGKQAELKKQMADALTADDKEQWEQLRIQYEDVGQQIKAYNKESQNQQKEIQKNIEFQNLQEGSLQRLKAELSLNTAAYNNLSEAERNAVKGSKLQDKINKTTETLKKEEKALGDHRREVGNYAIAGQALKAELKELTNQMISFAANGERNSGQYAELSKKASELRGAIRGVNAEIKAQSSSTANLDGLAQAVGGVVAAYGAWKSAASLLGIENETLGQTVMKLQAAAAALASWQQLTTVLNQKSTASILAKNIAMGVGNQLQAVNLTLTQAQSGAETKGIVTKAALAIATKAVTAAQWLWNAAMSVNPIFLLLGGIAALITGIKALTSVFDSSAKAEKEAAKASNEYAEQKRKTADEINQINNEQKNAVNERNNQLREEVLEMEKNGAKEADIAKVKIKAQQDIRDITIKASQDRIKQQQDEQKKLEASLLAEQKTLDIYMQKKGEQSKKYIEQKKRVDELIASLHALKQAQIDEAQIQIDASLKADEAVQQAAKNQKKAAKESNNKYQDNALKLLDLQKKLQDEQNKLAETGLSKDFFIQKQWEEKKFEQTQKHEKEKLEMQKKFNKITKAEYDVQHKILDTQEKIFQQNQIKSLNDYYAEQRKIMESLLGQSVDRQMKEVEEKYRKASEDFSKLKLVPKPEKLENQSDEDFKKEMDKWEKFQIEKAFYEVELEKKKAQEIETIRANSLSKILSDIENRTNKTYDDELAQFTDNEKEKNRIEIEMAKQRLSSKKIALQKELNEGKITQIDYDREIYNEEANLRSLHSQKNQIQLNLDLAQKNLSAKQRYEITDAYLKKEQKLYEGNAVKQMEIEKQIAENEKQLLEARAKAFEEWSDSTMDLLSGISGVMSNMEASELQEYEENNEKKKKDLQTRLDAGLISQQNYDKQVAKLDADLDKKKADIARKQAVREKLLKTFDIVINTAAAIMKNTAQLGLIKAIPVNIATGVLGAVQLAAVLAEPIPKASKGRLIVGKSHAVGGTLIEAEGGEAIINKRSVDLFAPLLSAINEA
ncbi:MAG: hypothetical protein FWF52_01180, partial [Candidatus Azobacteroides sp.]|nr:hypothetical protein [Candidatus Azobacteroides sp.]